MFSSPWSRKPTVKVPKGTSLILEESEKKTLSFKKTLLIDLCKFRLNWNVWGAATWVWAKLQFQAAAQWGPLFPDAVWFCFAKLMCAAWTFPRRLAVLIMCIAGPSPAFTSHTFLHAGRGQWVPSSSICF